MYVLKLQGRSFHLICLVIPSVALSCYSLPLNKVEQQEQDARSAPTSLRIYSHMITDSYMALCSYIKMHQ